jgi:Tfp pilus assembly protein PilX
MAGRPLLGSQKNPPARQRGFALIITLALLALLVLAVVALSALVKVGGQVSSAGAYQVQARQNALAGLNVGLSELQRHAGEDTRITAVAGITGIAANAGNTTRHWCGVWRSDGTFVAWLVSGAQESPTAALQNGVPGIELVSAGSVGAPAANSEHVIAGKIPIVVSETPGTPGVATIVGHYAFLVSDEGVKTPAYSPAPFPVVAPVIFANATNAQSRLRDALAAHAAKLPKVISYEQLAVLPSPALTSSILQDNFHHVTLASRTLNGTQLNGGMMNVNTNSAIFWRNLLQTYNTVPGIPTPIPSATVSARGTTIQNGMAGFSSAGKSANGPFLSIAAFGNYLATIFPATGSPTAAQILTAVGPMLTVRSDTFRLRAYGEALNPADPAKIEVSAYCEAIVQRTNDLAPNGLGRKFVILYFRWLGPDDI